MIDSDGVQKRAADLEEGDRVDLESCPVLHDEPIAEFEYVEVVEVRHEGGAVLVSYSNIGGEIKYQPDTILSVMA